MKFGKAAVEKMSKCNFCGNMETYVTKVDPGEGEPRAVITICNGCGGSGMAHEEHRGDDMIIEWYPWDIKVVRRG